MYEVFVKLVWTCDRCGKKEILETPEDENFPYVEANKIASLQKGGWTYANSGHICPKCVKKEFAPKKKRRKKARKKKVNKK